MKVTIQGHLLYLLRSWIGKALRMLANLIPSIFPDLTVVLEKTNKIEMALPPALLSQGNGVE